MMKGILELDSEDLHIPERENLMIVDCLNLCFRYKHKGQVDFASDFLRTVNSLAKSYGAREVVLTADWGASSYRKEILPSYKGDRKEKYKDQTEEESKKFAEFMEGYEKALELAKKSYPLLRFKYVEADDLAAYIVKYCKNKFTHIWLISTDKDWDLLLGKSVSRFSYAARKEFTYDNFYDEHGCDTPEEYTSVKVLQGDRGDSVPGIPLIGEKRAYNLIRQYGSALDIYVSMPLEGKQQFVRNLNDSGKLILLNYELMDLLSYCEDAIAHPDENNLEEVKQFCEELQ